MLRPSHTITDGLLSWDNALRARAPGTTTIRSRSLRTDLGMAGLPETWRHYEWKIAAVLFAVLCLFEAPISGVLPDFTL